MEVSSVHITNGDLNLNDKPRSGRPPSITDQEIQEILDQDSAQTQQQFSEKLSVSRQAISEILHALDSQEEMGALIKNDHASTACTVTSETIIQNEVITSHAKTAVNSKICKIPKIAAANKLPLETTPSKRNLLSNTPREAISKPEENILNYVHISDSLAPPRAVAVLPAALRYGRGAVTARCSLPSRVRFGPVSGSNQKIYTAEADELILKAIVSRRPIFLCKRENESVYHIDMSDTDRSNWFSLLPLGDQTTANVWLYEEGNVLYGITTKVIPPRIPLALGYSKEYAETHSILSPEVPVLDLHEALRGVHKNNQRLSSFAFLQRHADVEFKDEKRLRRKYRCSHCRKTFSRLFTLKRHVSRFCTRKAEIESTNLVASTFQEDKQTTPIQCSTPLMDDSRVPSDESLQNYTNGLDFSTNLFDTDRMPNLDMSGSSKSEAEFNPCYIENGNRNSSDKDDKKAEEKIVLCAYCDQPVVEEKYRHHYRECPSQRLECKCGKVFYKKENLSEHIHEKHYNDIKPKTLEPEIPVKEEVETPYKCDECKLNFKRRGMLVNHAWRVHRRRAAVPVERRVRHYPCGGCANVYRAAAKRDAHARKHHPGMEMHRLEPIEGERRRCEAAACPACPRQYVTRAKLLQHLRTHHPHLEAPSKIMLNPKSQRNKLQNC